MNLALDNINELSLMLLNKLVAFSYVKKCPSFQGNMFLFKNTQKYL